MQRKPESSTTSLLIYFTKESNNQAMHALAILFSAYSLFGALVVAMALFADEDLRETPRARGAGLVLLLVLAALQFMHFLYLQYHADWLHAPAYRMALFTAAPAFYLLVRPVLLGSPDAGRRDLLHFLPALAAGFLPMETALPLSFLLGAAYMIWLGHGLWSLRRQRHRFRLEMILLGIIFFVALGTTLLGFYLPARNAPLFFSLYTIAIGLGFLLTSMLLVLRPGLSGNIAEAAREARTSTLGRVDCPAALKELQRLMEEEKLFLDPELSLGKLAARLSLGPHQLSELVNSHLGKSLSRYLREYRVKEATRLLVEKPSRAVLSVGMDSGFSSQSNFYEAFREITGMTPGNYRKLHRSGSPES